LSEAESEIAKLKESLAVAQASTFSNVVTVASVAMDEVEEPTTVEIPAVASSPTKAARGRPAKQTATAKRVGTAKRAGALTVKKNVEVVVVEEPVVEDQEEDKENVEPIASPRRGRPAVAKKSAARGKAQSEEKTLSARGKRKRVEEEEESDAEAEEVELAPPKAKRSKVDPNKLTKVELKKILTSHNVKLPTAVRTFEQILP